MPAAALQTPSPLAPPPQQAASLDDGKVSETVRVTGQAPSLATQRGAQLEDDLDKTMGKVSAIDEATGALKPPAFSIPPPPEPKNTSPMEAWGSAAMMLATVGSLLTRQPLTTALNAAAGAMKAFHQNDMDAANLAFDQWKASTDMAVKQQNFQMEAYKAALSKAGSDERTAVAEFRARAAAFGDETAAQAAEQRGIDGAKKYLLDVQKANDNMMKNIGPITEGKDFYNALHDPQFQASLQGKSQQEQAEMKAQLVERVAPGLATQNAVYSEDSIKAMAEQALAGDKSVYQGMGYGKAGAAARVRLHNEVTNLAKERGMSGSDIAAANAEFAGMTSGERTLGTTQARIGLGAAEIQKLEPQVLQASSELKRTNYPNFNAAIQAGQHATGDPALKNLAVRLQGLKSAFSQVLTRGGVPTDSARATTDELFNTKDPEPVMKAAMEAMNAETGAIEQAPGMVRKQLRAGLDATKTPPHVTSQAEYDALQSGTVYTEDDGKQYTKP